MEYKTILLWILSIIISIFIIMLINEYSQIKERKKIYNDNIQQILKNVEIGTQKLTKYIDKEIKFLINNSEDKSYKAIQRELQLNLEQYSKDIMYKILLDIPQEYQNNTKLIELIQNKFNKISKRKIYIRYTISIKEEISNLKKRVKLAKKDNKYNISNKYAFIIGNSSYSNNKALKNPTNDAKAFAKLLKKLSFNIELGVDLDLISFKDRFEKFLSNINKEDSVIFFYAGHGVQYQGKNFLLPIGSINSIKKLSDFPTEAISLNYILTKLNEKSNLKFIILDACRTSPFSQFNIKRGLARGVKLDISSYDKIDDTYNRFLAGTLIAYSTSPEHSADDGDGEHSPYMTYLLKNIRLSNLTIENILKKTRADVVEKTTGFQTPWYESSINGDFYPAGTNSMEFMDILNLYALDKKDNNTIKWQNLLDKGSPIKWQTQGLHKEKYIYSKTGTIKIKNNGEYSHYIIKTKQEAVKWRIKLFGTKTQFDRIELSNNIFINIVQSNNGKLEVDKKYIKNEKILCNNDIFITDETTIKLIEIELPYKKPIKLLEKEYCRGIKLNCNYKYEIYLSNYYNKSLIKECQKNKKDAKELFLNENSNIYPKINKVSNQIFIIDNNIQNDYTQKNKSLKQDMPYSEAREIILNQGWQGKNKRWQDVSGQEISEIYYDNGWREIQDCATNAFAYCRFEFRNIKNQTLVVITAGECQKTAKVKCEKYLESWSIE